MKLTELEKAIPVALASGGSLGGILSAELEAAASSLTQRLSIRGVGSPTRGIVPSMGWA